MNISPNDRARGEIPALPVETWMQILETATFILDDPVRPHFVTNNRTLEYEWDPDAKARYHASMAVKRNVVLVGRTWYMIATESLYEHVTVHTREQLTVIIGAVAKAYRRFDGGSDEVGEGEGIRLGSLVKRLDLLIPDIDWWFLPGDVSNPPQEPQPVQLCRALPSLITLCFTATFDGDEYATSPLLDAITPRLQYFHPIGRAYFSFRQGVDLMKALPRLVCLSPNILNNWDTTSPNNSPKLAFEGLDGLSFPSILELQCSCANEFDIWYSRFHGTSFPNLKKVFLGFYTSDVEALQEFFYFNGHGLTEVHLQTAGFRPWTPTLPRLSLLRQHCPQLKEFRLTVVQGFSILGNRLLETEDSKIGTVTKFGVQWCRTNSALNFDSISEAAAISEVLDNLRVLSLCFPRLKTLQMLDDETLDSCRGEGP